MTIAPRQLKQDTNAKTTPKTFENIVPTAMMYTSTHLVLLTLAASIALAAKPLNLATNFLPFYTFSSPTIESEKCRDVYESDIAGCTDTVDFMNGAFCTPLCEEALRQVQQKLGEACEGVVPVDDTLLEKIMQYVLVESICRDGGSGHNLGPAGPEVKKLEGHWRGGGSEETDFRVTMPTTAAVIPSSTETVYSTVGVVTVSSETGRTVTISSGSAPATFVSAVVGSDSYSGIQFTAVQVTAPFDGGAAATTTDTSPRTAKPTHDSQTSADNDDGLSFAAKVGVGAGSGSVFLTLVSVACVIRRRKRWGKKAAVAEKSLGGPRRRLLEDGQPGF